MGGQNKMAGRDCIKMVLGGHSYGEGGVKLEKFSL